MRKLLFRYNNITTTIRYSIFTLKTIESLPKNQYYFIFNSKYNKKTIKFFIEHLFNVKIIRVATCRILTNSKKFGHYKKIIITLSKKNKINLFSK